MWLYEQVNMRIEGCIIVSTKMSPCYCWFSNGFPPCLLPRKSSAREKTLHTSLMISLNVQPVVGKPMIVCTAVAELSAFAADF